MGKRLTTLQKKEIVQLRGQGLDQRTVAAQVGCSQKTVSRLEHEDPDIREAIEQLQRNIISKGAPLAEEIILSALSVGKRLWRKAKDAKEPGPVVAANKEALALVHKNLKAVIQPVGFSAAPSQPFFLQQVFNQTQIQNGAEMLPAMAKYYKWKQDQDVLEYNAEVGESESGIEETTEQENMP
jgi:hypothetical protein